MAATKPILIKCDGPQCNSIYLSNGARMLHEARQEAKSVAKWFKTGELTMASLDFCTEACQKNYYERKEDI